MTNQTNRVQQLNQAKNVISDLEAELDSEMVQPRSRLGSASEWIRNDELYFQYLEEAMGRIAGTAIRTGHDDIATAAAELMKYSRNNE